MIWAITTYYNPENYSSRYENFKIFREKLGIPLIVVEFSSSGKFQLGIEDATILIQIPEGDILWQKERLLNIALSKIPDEVENVAWLDCDIIFSDTLWYEKAEKLLEKMKVIQLYSHMIHLSPGKLSPSDNNIFRSSVVKNIKDFGFDPKKDTTFITISVQTGDVESTHKEPGFAWAAKKDMILKFGLWDLNIIGGGDNAFVCALYGEFDKFIDHNWTYPSFFRRKKTKYYDTIKKMYFDWAIPLNMEVSNNIDCLDSTIYHLYHGDLKDRYYYKRYMDVAKIGFNPLSDIKINEHGAFELTDNFKLKNYLKKYFKIRNEDNNK